MADKNTGLIVSALPDYVEQNTPLLVDAYLKTSKSFDTLTHQDGVKGKAALNILNTDVEFQDGSECGFEPGSSQELTQRELETKLLKIQMNYCLRKLIGKWAEYRVRIDAYEDADGLPFEAEFMAGITSSVAEAVDRVIWCGDGDPNPDGLLKVIYQAKGGYDVIGSGYFDTVKSMLLAIPPRALKSDTVIFCGVDFLRGYTQELVEKNLYHFRPDESIEEVYIPGSTVKLVAVPGLTGTDHLVGGRISNLFVGYDRATAYENYRLWYSQDNEEFRLSILFNLGVQVAYPDNVIIGKYSA